MSQPPISVLTTQTALTDRQNIIYMSLPTFQHFGAQMQKQPLRRLYEPLIIHLQCTRF